MTEHNDPDNSGQFPLCEYLQKYVGDESAGLLKAALQMETEKRCGGCPHCKVKNESPTRETLSPLHAVHLPEQTGIGFALGAFDRMEFNSFDFGGHQGFLLERHSRRSLTNEYVYVEGCCWSSNSISWALTDIHISIHFLQQKK